ncbi:MAG: branched-chain amino acid ABC transporter permease [Burkholderiaceae bacterium]
MINATLFASQLMNGLVLGFLFVLISVGMSIIFGMLGLVNFAHGAFFALGAYIALTLRPHVGFVGALFLAPILVGVIGLAVERVLLRPLYNKEPLLSLLLTFGLALFIEELIRTLWGAMGHPFDTPPFLAGLVHYGPVFVTRYRVAVLAITIVLLAAVWLFLEKTPYGRIVRAGSRDPEMVSMLGINLKRVFMFIFGLGCLLAGAAGVLAAPLWSVVPSMAEQAIMPAFVVVVIGGLGSLRGAIVAGLMVGVAVAMTIQFWPVASTSIMYVLMIVVLLIRPRGLFGEQWERFE